MLLSNTTRSYAQQNKDSLSYYTKLALQPQSAVDLYKSYDFFKKSYESSMNDEDLESAIHNLYYIASIEYKRGAYDNSETTAVNAIKLLKKRPNTWHTTATKKSFYNLLGIMYEEQRNKNKALQLYKSTLQLAKTSADSAIIYNNISVVYKSHSEHLKAKKELQKAYNLLPRLKDTLTQALILDNLGVLYNEINKDGLPLMTKALKLREQVKDTSKIYLSYTHLSKYYYSLGDTLESKKYALKSLEFAENLKSASYKYNALGLLTGVSKDIYAKSFKKLNDSLYRAEQQSTNNYAMIRYDVSQKEKQLLKSENVKERIVLVTLFIALLSVFVYLYQKSKHKKEKLKEVYETESRISKQIHDDVSNDLFQIMTKLESKDQIGEELKNELHTLYYRTRDISKEHSLINKEYAFEDYLGELFESFNDENTSVIVKGISDISWDKVEDVKRTTIYKVLQELLINMRKYSKAELAVLIFKNKNSKIHISYSDNGIGCTLKKNTGLQNTENRINSIRGTIIFETEQNKGFKAKIRV